MGIYLRCNLGRLIDWVKLLDKQIIMLMMSFWITSRNNDQNVTLQYKRIRNEPYDMKEDIGYLKYYIAFKVFLVRRQNSDFQTFYR